MTLLLSVVRIGVVLLGGSVLGFAMTGALLPAGPRYRLERLGWSCALGCALVIISVPPGLALHVSPIVILIAFSAVGIALARRFRLTGVVESPLAERLPRVFVAAIVLAVAVYALRALTEPMWANDYIAIWGLKGKTIFGARSYPLRMTVLEYAHPEYPLGLPLLYAGVSFLTGGWDDHAMALLFPMFQVATLVVLVGWLRRRGAPAAVAGLAATLVAWFEPLYSGFLTGMAEVPLAFGVLLFGTSLTDALDETDPAAVRRLAVAAAFIVATKNEGLFYAVVGGVIGFVLGSGRRWKIALTPLVAAFLVRLLHWPWRSRLPLADFEPSLFSTERVWDSLAAAGALLGGATWAGLALVVVLIAFGHRVRAGDRLLLLVACGVAAYLVIPAFAVRGPEWLIQTTLLRTSAGLAPLAAGAIGIRWRERVLL